MAEFEALGPGGTEAQFQQFLSYLFRQSSVGLATTGVVAGLAVTQTATASASVLVAPGMGVAQDSVLNGATPLVNNTSKTQDVLVANPASANPRNDIVVFDAATKSIRVITGTPNATPTDPTVPTTAIRLARLRILGSATSVPTAQIDDLRTFTGRFDDAGAWVTLPINTSGGWSAGSPAPQARLLPNQQVEIRGALVGGASITRNDPIPMPAQFQPSASRHLPAVRTTSSVTGKAAVIGVYVDSAGALTFGYTDPAGLPTSVGYPLTGIYSL